MKRQSYLIIVASLVVALAAPAIAYAAGVSLYVRKSVSQNTAYSASSASRYYHASQGSVEQGGIAGMFSTIYSRTSSANGWSTRLTNLALPGGSSSGSVGSNGTAYYWRMGLSGPLSAGYGILNAF